MLQDSKSNQGWRRWIQFSLRSVVVLTVLVSLGLGVVRSFVLPYQVQQQAGETIRELGGSIQTEIGDRAWLQDWFGEEYVQDIVVVDLADCEINQTCVVQLAALPNLRMLAVGGKRFSDEELARFKSLRSLKYLVLDSTNATEDGVADLEESLPHLNILVSQRRAIAAIKPRARAEYGMFDIPEYAQDQFSDHFQYVDELYFSSQTDDDDLVELRHLPTMHSLTIGYARITDAGLRHFIKIPNLKCLRLYDTQITDDGIPTLLKLEGLDELDLRRTQVTSEGISLLRNRMPDTTIYW